MKKAPTAHQQWLKRSSSIYFNQRARYGIPAEWTLDYFRDWVQCVLVTQQHRCLYCYVCLTPVFWSLDHCTPLTRGGRMDAGNLCLCCPECNTRKGQHTHEEYRGLLNLVEDWDPRGVTLLWQRLTQGGQYRGKSKKLDLAEQLRAKGIQVE